MKYTLAIFDMDGTILSTLDDLCDSVNVILRNHNLPEHTLEEVRFMVGNGIPKLVQRALPADTDEATFKNLLDEFVKYYFVHCLDKTKPYDGIPELIQELKAAGIKIAVNTNKMQGAAEELCKKYFPNQIDFICGNREGLPVKPAPQGVFEIFKAAGLDNTSPKDLAKAVFIGDSDVDMQTGINAGIDVIGVDWGFRGEDFLRSHGADVIVREPDDLLKIIL